MNKSFVLPEESDVSDLIRYLERALKFNSGGAVRFRAYGDILTVYVAPIDTSATSANSTTILGLRTMALAKPVEFDLTLAIADVLASVSGEQTVAEFSLLKKLTRVSTAKTEVFLPERIVNEAWTNETPTRTGWELGGYLTEEFLTESARRGVTEIATTLPEAVGGPIADRIRNEIWGKAADYKYPVPLGAAFVAAGLGFLVQGEEVPWYVSGDWLRLSPANGHVLSKYASDYVSS